MNNLVSIITPTYNSAQFLAATLNSIINQTFTNWELMITDDCSTDNTFEILKEYASIDSRIKIARLEKNSGAGIARNNSIGLAKGRFIAFCDSDDLWKANKLEKQIEFMMQHKCALSYTSYDVINENDIKLGHVKSLPMVDYKIMLRNNYIGCLTAMYDTLLLGKIFMPPIRKRQDWALWLKILKKKSPALGLTDSLAIYRDRSGSISTNKVDLIKYHWAIYNDVEGFSTTRSVFLLLQYFYFYLLKKF